MSKRMFKGFSLTELLVVILIIGVLAAILFPAFARARETAGDASCIANMNSIGNALGEYTTDYDGALIKCFYGLPPAIHGVVDWAAPVRPANRIRYYSWRWAALPYLKDVKVLACPSNPVAVDPKFWTNGVTEAGGTLGQWLPGGYAANRAVIGFANGPGVGLTSGLTRTSDITNPAQTIAVADTRYVWNDVRINWIAGSMVSGASLPQGSSYQGGRTPCGVKQGPPPPPDVNDPCAYDNQGTFQMHDRFVNFIFCDNHAKALKLAATALPNDLWDSGLSLSSRVEIVKQMQTAYY